MRCFGRGSTNLRWLHGSIVAEAAGMSRSAFAARFKELLGQTPLEYVTEWRMQKAMQLLQQRDKKLIDVARSVLRPKRSGLAAFAGLRSGASSREQPQCAHRILRRLGFAIDCTRKA